MKETPFTGLNLARHTLRASSTPKSPAQSRILLVTLDPWSQMPTGPSVTEGSSPTPPTRRVLRASLGSCTSAHPWLWSWRMVRSLVRLSPKTFQMLTMAAQLEGWPSRVIREGCWRWCPNTSTTVPESSWDHMTKLLRLQRFSRCTV